MTHRHLLLASGALAFVILVAYSYRTSEIPFDPRNLETPPPQSSVACEPVPLLSHSVAPHSTFIYRYYGPWDPGLQMCVDRAFTTWNTALQSTGITFVSELQNKKSLPTNVSVILAALPEHIGGAIPQIGRRPDGYMRSGAIFFSDDASRLNSCKGYYKVALHEIGHLLGLGHPDESIPEATVMNNMSGANDDGNAIPLSPTTCDVAQVNIAGESPRTEKDALFPTRRPVVY